MSRDRPVSVILADGNPLVLSAMSELFERDPRFGLVATAGTAEGFLATVIRLPVEVGIVDWALPPLGGARVAEAIRDQDSTTRLVVYGDPSGDAPRRAMAAGAAAFCDRTAPPATLLRSCLEVAEGRMSFPFLDVRELRRDPVGHLSRRERAMLAALSEGLSNRELAARFGISGNTVKFHLSNLYGKLGVRGRGQAIAFYYAVGLAGGGGAGEPD
jgi:two-component system nitrate/nitrite response regulator NarP